MDILVSGPILPCCRSIDDLRQGARQGLNPFDQGVLCDAKQPLFVNFLARHGEFRYRVIHLGVYGRFNC